MESKVKDYIQKKVGGDVDFGNDDDIFAKGFVNSMFAMQLVMFLEREFAIKVKNEEMSISNFNTVNNIAAFISSKIVSV